MDNPHIATLIIRLAHYAVCFGDGEGFLERLVDLLIGHRPREHDIHGVGFLR